MNEITTANQALSVDAKNRATEERRWAKETMIDLKPKRIFVSSTINDLLPFRDAAKKVIAWTGCEQSSLAL